VLVLTLPEFVLLGLLIGMVSLLRSRVRRLGEFEVVHIQRAVLLMAAVFPIVFAALMKTPFYDGYRHVLFVVPPIVIASAIGVGDLWHRFQRTSFRRVFGMVFAGLLLWTLSDMVRVHPNQSVYFNHLIAGGIQQASKDFETDYWGNSYKQAFDWIEAHYPWDYSRGKLKVASFFGQLHNVMDQDLFERIEVYEKADLYLGTTRFDHHRLIPGEVIHTVRADDVPLLYIIRPDERYNQAPFFEDSAFRRMYLGMRFFGPNQIEKEAAFLKRVKAQNLGYFVAGAYNNAAMIQQEIGESAKATDLYQKALAFYQDHLTALYNFGQLLYEQENYQAAIDAYERMRQYEIERILDKQAVRNIYYILGGCYVQLGRYGEAVDAYRHALKIDPQSSGIANNLASVYIEQERFVLAYDLLRPLVETQADNVIARMNLATVLVRRDSLDEALQLCQDVLNLEPNTLEAYVLKGQIYQAIGKVESAREAYGEALKRAPENEILQKLIRTLEN